MIVAQINELKSLSHITKKLKYNEEIQTSFLLDGIRTFQLSRKQRILTPNLFEKIFHHLVGEVLACSKNQPIFRDIGQLSMIDSSTMSMSLSPQPWATLSITKTGVRLHLRVVVIKDQTVPDNAVQLPTKHADRTQMDELTFENQNGL